MTDLLLRSNEALESWMKGGILLTDTTKLGAETILSNHQEGLASSSEAAKIVVIPGVSTQDRGIRFVATANLSVDPKAEGLAIFFGFDCWLSYKAFVTV